LGKNNNIFTRKSKQ